MRTLIIAFGMLFLLFGPTTFFAVVGYKALQTLGKRPSHGRGVMLALMFKLVVAIVISVVMLGVLLKIFGPKPPAA